MYTVLEQSTISFCTAVKALAATLKSTDTLTKIISLVDDLEMETWLNDFEGTKKKLSITHSHHFAFACWSVLPHWHRGKKYSLIVNETLLKAYFKLDQLYFDASGGYTSPPKGNYREFTDVDSYWEYFSSIDVHPDPYWANISSRYIQANVTLFE